MNITEWVENVFRGTIFLVLSFSSSLGRLFLRPHRSAVWLNREARKKDSNQVRPFVFAFVSLIVALYLPTIIEALRPPPPPGELVYVIHDSAVPEPDGIGR